MKKTVRDNQTIAICPFLQEKLKVDVLLSNLLHYSSFYNWKRPIFLFTYYFLSKIRSNYY